MLGSSPSSACSRSGAPAAPSSADEADELLAARAAGQRQREHGPNALGVELVLDQIGLERVRRLAPMGVRASAAGRPARKMPSQVVSHGGPQNLRLHATAGEAAEATLPFA